MNFIKVYKSHFREFYRSLEKSVMFSFRANFSTDILIKNITKPKLLKKVRHEEEGTPQEAQRRSNSLFEKKFSFLIFVQF